MLITFRPKNNTCNHIERPQKQYEKTEEQLYIYTKKISN